MWLLDELSRRATASGKPLSRLGQSADRYGPVEAISFFTTGYVSVRRCGADYHVTVWDHERLVADGRTSTVDDIVRTMQDCQDGLPITSPYLARLDRRTAAEALWRLLDEHGDEHLRPVFQAAAANPELRALHPWVSHGALHLVHPDDSPRAERRGLAFHPHRERFQVFIYGGTTSDGMELSTAIAFAGHVAARWEHRRT
jgi:hypothetical protein